MIVTVYVHVGDPVRTRSYLVRTCIIVSDIFKKSDGRIRFRTKTQRGHAFFNYY